MTTREQFRARFAKYFEEAGCTQEELASAVGKSRSTISCWLLGKSFPRADVMEKLAAFLRVSVPDLIGYDPRDQETILLDMFHEMNDDGKAKLIERAEELVLLYGEKISDNTNSAEVVG